MSLFEVARLIACFSASMSWRVFSRLLSSVRIERVVLWISCAVTGSDDRVVAASLKLVYDLPFDGKGCGVKVLGELVPGELAADLVGADAKGDDACEAAFCDNVVLRGDLNGLLIASLSLRRLSTGVAFTSGILSCQRARESERAISHSFGAYPHAS